MGLLKRGGGTKEQPQPARVIPEASKTLGHELAVTFSQSILDERWTDAEAAFAASSLVDQAHMVEVASDMGGARTVFDSWTAMGTGTGLCELLRGATAIVTAWDIRSGASNESVSSEAIDEFHELLGAAEEDLHSAAELMPNNSIPWRHLLTSGRGLRINRVEMDERYVRHIERGELLAGHMSFQQLISSKWSGSHEEMWEHAEWINRTSQPGSPNHALVAVALIENHIMTRTKHDTIRELPKMIGKSDIIGHAAHQSYGDASFDASTPEGAMALSAWFTVHYVMGNWEHAGSLMEMMGTRFSRFPMNYFHDSTWPQIQQYVYARLAGVAAA